MSSLNHVKMWTKRGYEPTTVKEADRQHPGGTVPAASGFSSATSVGYEILLHVERKRDTSDTIQKKTNGQ